MSPGLPTRYCGHRLFVSLQIWRDSYCKLACDATIKGLWERVFLEAEAKFETERLETRQSLSERQQQLSTLQTDYNRAQQQIATITEEKLAIINEKL